MLLNTDVNHMLVITNTLFQVDHFLLFYVVYSNRLVVGNVSCYIHCSLSLRLVKF